MSSRTSGTLQSLLGLLANSNSDSIDLVENIYGSEDFITMINTGVPTSSPDEALTLQSYIGSCYIAPEEEASVPYPRNLSGLIEWLDNYPLRTLTRAIHLANPSTTRWWFDRILPQDLGEDFIRNKRMLAVVGWRFHPDTSSRPWFKELDDEMGWVTSEEKGINFLKVHPHRKPWFIPSAEVSLAIIIQPPWVLSWEDLNNVAECRNVSHSFYMISALLFFSCLIFLSISCRS